jgi:DNA-binding XRE family transcriptional regulator
MHVIRQSATVTPNAVCQQYQHVSNHNKRRRNGTQHVGIVDIQPDSEIEFNRLQGIVLLDTNRLYAIVGDRIRQIREAQTPRMSQGDLAKILGLQRTSVTNMELGKQKPTLETLLRVCEHFSLEIDAIVPRIRELTLLQAHSVVVGGKSQEVGAKTASLLSSLRGTSRVRE